MQADCRLCVGGWCVQSGARQRAPAGLDMTVNVLTSGYWPSYPVMDARMPAELSLSQQASFPLMFTKLAVIILE